MFLLSPKTLFNLSFPISFFLVFILIPESVIILVLLRFYSVLRSFHSNKNSILWISKKSLNFGNTGSTQNRACGAFRWLCRTRRLFALHRLVCTYCERYCSLDDNACWFRSTTVLTGSYVRSLCRFNVAAAFFRTSEEYLYLSIHFLDFLYLFSPLMLLL